MTLVAENWRSAPVIVDGHVVHHIENERGDGGYDEVFVFGGTYKDARDNDIARRICAIPDLIVAAGQAARAIETLHLQNGETDEGMALKTRLLKIMNGAHVNVENARNGVNFADQQYLDEIYHSLALYSEDLEKIVGKALLRN